MARATAWLRTIRGFGLCGGVRLVVDRRDHRLHLVRADRRGRAAVISETPSVVADVSYRPPVLLGERDEFAVRAGTGGPARLGEQRQGELAGHLRVVRQERVDGPGEPDRVPGEFYAPQLGARAAGVTLLPIR